MKEKFCKVCNCITHYDNTDVYQGDGYLYIICEHCMNEIRIENEKF